MHRFATALVAVVSFGASSVAWADPDPETQPIDEAKPVKRTREETIAHIFRGPFQSSRIYTMPTADVVGAYVMSVSADSSLLQDTGVLTSAGVLAVGFGDIAQLEYRHTSAISVTGVNAPVPTAGAQLKLPIPERSGVPAIGVAFRLGVPRTETLGDTDIVETVTDLYLVGRLRFDGARWFTFHGGARFSTAKISLSGGTNLEADRKLVLPTAAIELAPNPTSRLVAEVSMAPRFVWMPGVTQTPSVGYGVLGRFGMRWTVLPSVILDGSIGYQLDVATDAPAQGPGAIVQWDIRLGAEVFVPWGALACRAVGVFCD